MSLLSRLRRIGVIGVALLAACLSCPQRAFAQGITLTEGATILALDGASQHELGRSIAISGDTMVSGAAGNNCAYVFIRTSGVWSQQAKLTASDGPPAEN